MSTEAPTTAKPLVTVLDGEQSDAICAAHGIAKALNDAGLFDRLPEEAQLLVIGLARFTKEIYTAYGDVDFDLVKALEPIVELKQ